MSQYQITIDTDGAAFGEDAHTEQDEVARILTQLAERLRDFGVQPPSGLRDANGNTVGALTITPDNTCTDPDCCGGA